MSFVSSTFWDKLRHLVSYEFKAWPNCGPKIQQEGYSNESLCAQKVFNVRKLYQESKTTFSKPVPGRTRSVPNQPYVSKKGCKEILAKAWYKTEVTKHFEISATSVRRIMHGNLGLKTYKMESTECFLSQNTKRKKILNKFSCAADKIFIWSDKKFTVKSFVKYHNVIYSFLKG